MGSMFGFSSPSFTLSRNCSSSLDALGGSLKGWGSLGAEFLKKCLSLTFRCYRVSRSALFRARARARVRGGLALVAPSCDPTLFLDSDILNNFSFID